MKLTLEQIIEELERCGVELLPMDSDDPYAEEFEFEDVFEDLDQNAYWRIIEPRSTAVLVDEIGYNKYGSHPDKISEAA